VVVRLNQAMYEIQAIAPRGEGGNETRRMQVEFFEEADFRRRLEAGWAEAGSDPG
jgi:hypothetical protein